MTNCLYAGWHNHTDKSNHENRDSIIPVEQLIDIALELGHTGVGITDHGVLSSHVKAIKHLDKLKNKIDKQVKEIEDKYLGEEFSSQRT